MRMEVHVVSQPSGDSIAIIVGAHPFPHGNASATRMLGLAQVLRGSGRLALVVNDDPRLTDAATRQHGTSGGVPYVNVGAPSATRLQRWMRRRTLGRRIAATITEVSRGDDVDLICVPSFFYTPSTRRALRGAARTATLVVDVVERHDATQFARGRFAFYFIRHRLTSWYSERTADRVIVISNALANGPFVSRGPFVLPPIVDPVDLLMAAEAQRRQSPTTVAYIGSPSSKDRLSGLVEAIDLMTPAERRDLRVVVAGIDRNALAELPELVGQDVDAVSDVLQVVGKLDRNSVIDLLSKTHYTILIRDPEADFARFGFPTKIPESMAAGCPPIANLTSDLGDYLVDEHNALICPGTSREEIAATLRRAMADVNSGRFTAQNQAAVRTAVESFSPAAFIGKFSLWLSMSGQ